MSSILVVESEGLITRSLKDALGDDDYQIIMLPDGDDAVQFALREVPGLIIIDLARPEQDSYDIIHLLRSHPKCMHIPITVLSVYGSTSDKVRAFELGVDNYIVKSRNIEELVAELVACAHSQLRRAQQSSLSPLTLLPGGLQLERAIDRKLSSQEPWSILYLDLDNFKAFNDVYGFLAGNNMILLVGHICQRVVYEHGNPDDFVGHIGGDDFVIVTSPDCANMLCRNILLRYKEESAVFYRREDLERGSISGRDRKGRPYQFPLVSLSIGVVSSQLRCTHSLAELSSLAAEAKRDAKQSSNNLSYVSTRMPHAPQWIRADEAYRPRVSLASAPLYQSSFEHRFYHFLENDILAESK